MHINDINRINQILRVIGIDEAKKILFNWLDNEDTQIEFTNEEQFGLISAYSLWTTYTEQNDQSIISFLGYILMKSKIHNDKKFNKKDKQKIKEQEIKEQQTITFIMTTTELINKIGQEEAFELINAFINGEMNLDRDTDEGKIINAYLKFCVIHKDYTELTIKQFVEFGTKKPTQ